MAEDKELTAHLKLAKTKPMFFALVAKGSDGKLLVDKNRIPPKVSAEAKKEFGGGTLYVGRVKTEEGVLTFETGKPVPEPIAALTKKVIKRDAALTLEVAYRVATDLAGEDTGDSAPPSDAEVPPAPPPPAPDIAARLGARLKALGAALQKVEAMGSPLAAQAKAQIAEAGKLYQATQYEQSSASLDRGEALLKQALLGAKGAAPSATSASAPDADLQKRVAARLKALEPVLQKIAGSTAPQAIEARQVFRQAHDSAERQDFASATDALNETERLIKEALKSATKAPAPAAPPVLPLWVAAKEEVGGQLSALQDAMRGTRHRLLMRIADQGLNALTRRLQVGLQVALMEVDGAAPDARPARATTAKGIVAEFRKFLQTDPSLPLLDANPLGVPVTIRTRLGAAMDEIETALSR